MMVQIAMDASTTLAVGNYSPAKSGTITFWVGVCLILFSFWRWYRSTHWWFIGVLFGLYIQLIGVGEDYDHNTGNGIVPFWLTSVLYLILLIVCCRESWHRTTWWKKAKHIRR